MQGKSIRIFHIRILITSFLQLLLSVDSRFDGGMIFLAEVISVSTSLTTQAVSLQMRICFCRRILLFHILNPRSQINVTRCCFQSIAPSSGALKWSCTEYLFESLHEELFHVVERMQSGSKSVQFLSQIRNYWCLQIFILNCALKHRHLGPIRLLSSVFLILILAHSFPSSCIQTKPV